MCVCVRERERERERVVYIVNQLVNFEKELFFKVVPRATIFFDFSRNT